MLHEAGLNSGGLAGSIQDHMLTRLGNHANDVVEGLKADFELDSHQWRDVVHTTVAGLLGDIFKVPWAQGKPMREVVRRRLLTVLEEEGHDMRGKSVKTVGGKYMDATEQNKRCDELIDAQLVARESKEVQGSLLNLMRDMMKSGFPADMFNLNEFDNGNINIGFRAMNDLVINFCFWALENEESMTDDHRLVFYMYMFRGFDAEAIYKKILMFEKKDNDPKQKIRRGRTDDIHYSLISHDDDREKAHKESIAIIETHHRDVLEFFERKAPGLIEKFLDRSNFKSTNSRDIVGNYSEYVARKNSALESLDESGDPYSAASTQGAIKRSISFPENEMGVCLEEGLIVQAQRGNITARNTLLISIYRLISSIAFGPKARYHISGKKLGSTEDYYDIEQTLVNLALKKIIATDPRLSRLSTYIGNWCERVVDQHINELELVRKPAHIHQAMTKIRKHPELPDKAIAKKCGVSLNSVKNARKLLAQKGYVRLDAPRYEGSNNSGSNAERLLEASTYGSFLEEVHNCLVGDGLKMCLERLPPRDRYIIVEHVINGRTLDSVGKDLGGLTRERIRQLCDKILDNLRGTNEDGTPLANEQKKRGTINMIVNEDAFEAWCDENCENIERVVDVSPYFLMRAMLGLEPGTFGNYLVGPKLLEKYFASEGIDCESSVDTLCKRLKSLEKRLVVEQSELPLERRFLLVTNVAEVYRAAREHIKGFDVF